MADLIDKRNQKAILYRDIETNFSIHPVSLDCLTLVNEESIKRSLKNLILTNKYERLFNPDFGCNIRKLLFENFEVTTQETLRELIEEAIKNYEPRVNLLKVDISIDEDNHRVLINIIFSILNKEDPVNYTLEINRIR